METLSWPPNYVARCPVFLYEAAQGSASWHASCIVGELHMRPLDTEDLHFQLCDLLDGQVLFEHTMSNPDAFAIVAQRFFVIRHENGSHKGFGFNSASAAREMTQRIENHLASSDSRTAARRISSFQIGVQPSSRAKRRSRRRPRFRAVRALVHLFKKNEIEIGYPTDVKHVAHIGWDGHSDVSGPSSMDSLRAAPDYSTGPLRNFGQTEENQAWILDASSAAKWTLTKDACQLPPQPPHQFMDGSTRKKR